MATYAKDCNIRSTMNNAQLWKYRDVTDADYALAKRIEEALKKGALQLNKTANNRYNQGMKPHLVLAVMLNRDSKSE